jgi:hypothetical protein
MPKVPAPMLLSADIEESYPVLAALIAGMTALQRNQRWTCEQVLQSEVVKDRCKRPQT